MMAVLKLEYESEYQYIDQLRKMPTNSENTNKYGLLRSYFKKWCVKNSCECPTSLISGLDSNKEMSNNEKFDLFFPIVIDTLEKKYHQKGQNYQEQDEWWKASESEKFWSIFGYPLEKQNNVHIDDILAAWKSSLVVSEDSEDSRADKTSDSVCFGQLYDQDKNTLENASTVPSTPDSPSLTPRDVVELFGSDENSSKTNEKCESMVDSLTETSRRLNRSRSRSNSSFRMDKNETAVDDSFIEVKKEEEEDHNSDWVYVPENTIVNLV